MENNSILYRIKSKFIFYKIFGYIEQPKLVYKLFVYSKSFQKKIERELVDYERIYLEQFGINWREYLFCSMNRYINSFDKNLLKNFLKEDISKNNLDYNLVEKIIIDIYKKYDQVYKESKNNGEEDELPEKENLIEIYSPFFDVLSKTDIFEYFSIFISSLIIDEYALKNDYISTFSKLNACSSKYSSLTFCYKDSNDITYLKEFNINFGQIKRLTFIIDDYFNTKDYEYFFSNFFGLKNIGTSLVKLILNVNWTKFMRIEIDPKLIKNLNNFKLLGYLTINGIKLSDNFTLNLCNLKILYLENCENFTFSENSLLNIKQLKLINCFINKSKSLIEIPKLEKGELRCLKDKFYFSILNFNNCNKIKNLIIDANDFIYIDNNSPIEVLTLLSNSEVNYEIKEKIFEKLISMKYLKEITIEFGKIVDEEISIIKGENPSVEKITINWVKENNDLIINNLLEKFPNLTSLVIGANEYSSHEDINLELKEQEKCKINKLILNIGGYNNIKFFISNYENLQELRINLNNTIKNMENTIPIFNEKCNVIFKSLKIFNFQTYTYYNNIDFKIIENLYNNMDNMPNLEDLFLTVVQENMNEEFYKKFVVKILSLPKLKKIYFSIQTDMKREIPYSEEEIKEIYPNIDFSRYDKIFIHNFKSDENIIFKIF